MNSEEALTALKKEHTKPQQKIMLEQHAFATITEAIKNPFIKVYCGKQISDNRISWLFQCKRLLTRLHIPFEYGNDSPNSQRNKDFIIVKIEN